MTQRQRERWEAKTLAAIRKNLRQNLAILTLMPAKDKEEVETRVMAEIKEAVAKTSDADIERPYSTLSFDSKADSMALDILQEQDMEREHFEWGFKR